MANLVFNVLTILEVVCIEFATIWLISQKKHSFIVALASYIVITGIILIFMQFVAIDSPDYGTGSGRFLFMGLLYFIPVIVNYGGDIRSRIVIAFYAFSYGLGCFAAAVRITYLFQTDELGLIVFIIQSLIYLLTFPLYIHFSAKYVIPYFNKTNNKQKNILIQHTISSFFLLIFYNNMMVLGASELKKLFVFLLLIYFIVLTYLLLVSYLKADKDKDEFKEFASTDSLTSLGNHSAMWKHIDLKILEGKPFTLFFLDLNSFKSVNDTYGHAFGDSYLQSFCNALKVCVSDGSCFRYGGDEFVCISEKGEIDFDEISFKIGELRFKGVSVGKSAFPEDATTAQALILLADERMYKAKALSKDTKKGK